MGNRLRGWRPWLAALGALAIVAGAFAGWGAVTRPPGYVATARFITVHTGPGGNVPVRLDTTYYRPESATAQNPVPAILLAHGYGQTKYSVAGDAERFAEHGFAVMTWTAEGFGRSGGQIHMDSPDWEVRDASQLIDWLAGRPEVERDSSGAPRVAAVGGSYGGALSLLLAAYDHRVDAVVAEITWNDLARSFFPNDVAGGTTLGVFKKAWAGLLFGGGSGARVGLPGSGGNPSCGRLAAPICQLYLQASTTGTLTPAQRALLERSSPAGVLGRIRAPTLLVQGETDSLFPLSEADATAAGISRTGTPVRVAWYTGGHDGGGGTSADQGWIHAEMLQWLNHYLRGTGPAPGEGFIFSRLSGYDDAGDPTSIASVASRYPGLGGRHTRTVTVSGPPQVIANPPDGTPAATSSVPGLGSPDAAMTGAAAREIPGQHADFISPALKRPVTIVGSPTVRLRVASPTGGAVLFVKLYDLQPKLGPTLPGSLVAPIRLSGLPTSIAAARPVTVQLPAIVHQVPAGDRLLIVVATSDQAYLGPSQPADYTVMSLGSVELPMVSGTALGTAGWYWPWVLVALAALLLLGLGAAIVAGRWRRRSGSNRTRAEHANVPLVVDGLGKEYANGFRAVDDISFRVEREQVLGMLGPNGAGKTTTLRVLLGLTAPTRGAIYVFGHPLRAGAPVLSRLGALVEGPGFLPHLSGADNLRRFWQATGRPAAEARFEEVLDIAGLGTASARRVGTYSHGMRQRLAIAQAMLGLPDLLVLDEPTDGLDPPQIAEMRRVLQGYASQGRAVLISSHMLAEVEQTCTHAVVVHRGRVVASGSVAELIGEGSTVLLDVSDPGRAIEVLRRLGVEQFREDGDRRLVCDLDGVGRGRLVNELVAAGVAVDRIAPQRRLEDAFLDLVGGGTEGSGER